MRRSWQAAVGLISRKGDDAASKTPQNPAPPRSDTSFAVYPSLAGKVALVTGGASGIGEEIVRSLAAQGAHVGFIDTQAERGARLERELQGTGGSVRFFPCDLTDVEALKIAADQVAGAFGPIAILVNNAANDDRHDWRQVTPAYFDERLAINLRHFFFAIQAVAPGMIAAGGGSIVNFGSIAASDGFAGLPVYSAAKAGIHGLTRSFARELGRHRIRVNTIIPGWVMTERQKELWAKPDALKHHLQRQCLPDAIHPVHVARMVLFLASDDSSMCTASSYMVEAGL